jgi:hypothetical protein
MLPDPKKPVRRHTSRLPRSYAERYRDLFAPKMFRSSSLEPNQIDDLYSELVCSPGW